MCYTDFEEKSMFKLINAKDEKVLSGAKFIKNADFFKDSLAFFDAYSALCEKQLEELPHYCIFQNKNLCLEGICLFIKTYASEFEFSTIDLSIDYLKTLYYAIAALSKDGKVVERDFVVNEFLVYKDTNQKYQKEFVKQYDKAEQKYADNLNAFNKTNNRYAKYFMSARLFDIFATLVVIFSLFVAVFPVAFYFSGKILLKSMIIYVAASVLIGLILRFEFKMIMRYLSNIAAEDAYVLQTLKKNKDESFQIFNDIKIKSGKILCEFYQYKNNVVDFEFSKKLAFDDVFALAKKNDIQSFNIKRDIAKMDKHQQEHTFEILDRILSVGMGDLGRFENLYEEILSFDYLKFNNLIKLNYLNKFIEIASMTNRWKLDLQGAQVNPFDVDAKALVDEQVRFVSSKNENLNISLSMFLKTKYAKKIKSLQLKNIKDENSFYQVKLEYINRFYLTQVQEEKEIIENKIPKFINLKLRVLKNRVMCNTLGDDVFFKIKEIVKNYEKTLHIGDLDDVDDEKVLLDEKTAENKNFIRTLFECDAIKDLGNDEVLCVVGEKSFRGFKLSNI